MAKKQSNRVCPTCSKVFEPKTKKTIYHSDACRKAASRERLGPVPPDSEKRKKTSGIYAIICQPTGKFYIGQSINIEGRIRGHKMELRRGTHCNSHLQAAWNKHGAKAFEYKVVFETNDTSKLDGAERVFIEAFPKDMLFNLAEVGKPPPSTRKSIQKARASRLATTASKAINRGLSNDTARKMADYYYEQYIKDEMTEREWQRQIEALTELYWFNTHDW